MKSVFKILGFLMFFSLISCDKELYDEPIHRSNKFKVEKISANQLMQQISNPTIKNYLSTLTKDLSGNLEGRLTDEELLYFQMFVKENEYTSYSLRLNDFSTEKPYFLDFVIKTDSEGEKAGFIKYIPEEATSTFDSRTFTGDIEVINLNNHVVANNAVVGGIAINQASIAATQCFSAIQLVQHNCTHGGNHAPGEACDGPGGNNGYYEIIITNFCLTFPEDLNFIAAPDVSMGDNSGGGFVPLSAVDVAFNNFLSTLTPEQTDVLATNPKLIEYLKDNEVSNDSKDKVLQLIAIVLENDLELDFSPQNEVNEDITNLSELSDYVESIHFDVEDDAVGNVSTNNQEQNVGTKTIALSPIIDLTIEVVSTPQPNFSLDTSNSTSYISNVVIGNDWVQNSMIISKMNYSSTHAQITLMGYVNIGINIPSLGLQFGIKQRRKITFLIDKTTGELCCSTITKL